MTQGYTNPRFLVTSLKASKAKARHLYEKVYYARGEMEIRSPALLRKRLARPQ